MAATAGDMALVAASPSVERVREADFDFPSLSHSSKNSAASQTIK